MIRIERYHAGLLKDWDEILMDSRMSTFLHRRSYMDYHGDRFEDFSLVAYEKGRPVALLPANRSGDRMYSHQGLTYGGLVFRKNISVTSQVCIANNLIAFSRGQGIATLHLKPVPKLFAPDQQGLHKILETLGAELIGREVSLAIPLPLKVENWDRGKRWGLRRGLANNLEVRETDSFTEFWELVLAPNLYERFHAKPVHSLAEITMLARKHPIRQFNVYGEGELLAGMTVYEMPEVAHVQYLSATSKGKYRRALDFLIYELGTRIFADKKYLDLGTSHEEMGKVTKTSLFKWKSEYGTVPFAHEHHLIRL
jgi:hypothetical protein